MWCSKESRPDSDSEEEVSAVALELRRTLGLKGKAHKPRLTITQWLAAFERYALAAVITQQWSMVDSLAQYIYIYRFHVLVRSTPGPPGAGSLVGFQKIGLQNMVPALRINQKTSRTWSWPWYKVCNSVGIQELA